MHHQGHAGHGHNTMLSRAMQGTHSAPSDSKAWTKKRLTNAILPKFEGSGRTKNKAFSQGFGMMSFQEGSDEEDEGSEDEEDEDDFEEGDDDFGSFSVMDDSTAEKRVSGVWGGLIPCSDPGAASSVQQNNAPMFGVQRSTMFGRGGSAPVPLAKARGTMMRSPGFGQSGAPMGGSGLGGGSIGYNMQPAAARRKRRETGHVNPASAMRAKPAPKPKKKAEFKLMEDLPMAPMRKRMQTEVHGGNARTPM
jgi:hypothetical protein